MRLDFCRIFSRFTRTIIKILLKFPAFTFNKPKASNTEANSVVFIMKGEGGHLNFAIPQGDHRKFTHIAGDH